MDESLKCRLIEALNDYEENDDIAMFNSEDLANYLMEVIDELK